MTPSAFGKARGSIAALASIAIGLHLGLRYGGDAGTVGPLRAADLPLGFALLLGGGPLVVELAAKSLRREFGSDLDVGMVEGRLLPDISPEHLPGHGRVLVPQKVFEDLELAVGHLKFGSSEGHAVSD
jgi:hypothetical protein